MCMWSKKTQGFTNCKTGIQSKNLGINNDIYHGNGSPNCGLWILKGSCKETKHSKPMGVSNRDQDLWMVAKSCTSWWLVYPYVYSIITYYLQCFIVTNSYHLVQDSATIHTKSSLCQLERH